MWCTNIPRFILSGKANYLGSTIRFSSKVVTVSKSHHAADQVEYIKSAISSQVDDWKALKTEVLNIKGSLNEKNLDGVFLKIMMKEDKLDKALSFAEYIKSSEGEINLGVTNGILSLYHHMSLKTQLTNEQKQFILNSYESLYKKYEVLDCATSESLLHALCAIGEYKKALRVMNDIYLSGKPTHSAYSTVIATLFQLNKKKEALEMIEISIRNQRPLTNLAYEAWINYIVRKYKTKDTILKYLQEICKHISLNFVVIPETTAGTLRKTFFNLGWHARFTRIKKPSGQCVYCRQTLECLKLSEQEFELLQKNVKEKLIVGSDVLLKTSENELNRFLEFINKTGPYDVVLDALNICYAVGKFKMDKVGPLTFVIEHFKQQNKKILLIGRKHMLKWPKMIRIMSKTLHFFTDDVSEDDPYFITAAILSGSHTDFVSKDLLRGHRFNLQDKQLRHIFQRWQWQHQWKAFVNTNGAPILKSPLPITPCAQKTGPSWHLPFEREEPTGYGQIRDGTPDWDSWMCLQPAKPDVILEQKETRIMNDSMN